MPESTTNNATAVRYPADIVGEARANGPLGTPAPPSATITAAEMVRLTGVGRERLRTWERRHGFPQPVRTANNTRRYLADDVRRVIAVSAAVAQGAALAEAVAHARDLGTTNESQTELGSVLEEAPLPVIAVAGPDPLRVVWANGVTRAAPDAPQVGDDIEFGAIATLQALRRLLIGEGPSVMRVRCEDWVASFPSDCSALAWRAPHGVTEEPSVVLMRVPDSSTRGADVAARSSAMEQTMTWGEAVGAARKVLQRERGLGGVHRALAQLLAGTGGIDAMVATLRGSTMRSARSVHGTIGPHAVEILPDGEIARAIADAEVDWVGPSARTRFGIGTHNQAIVIPIIAGGDAFGAVFLVFSEELPLADLTRELLLSIGTMVGLILAREQLLAH